MEVVLLKWFWACAKLSGNPLKSEEDLLKAEMRSPGGVCRCAFAQVRNQHKLPVHVNLRITASAGDQMGFC